MYDPGMRARFQSGLYLTETLIAQGSTSLNRAMFTYKLYAVDLPSLGSTTVDHLRKLRLVCWWWDDGAAPAHHVRSEYGNLSVELVRMILSSGSY